MRLLSTTIVLRGGNYPLLLKKLKMKKVRVESAEITKRNRLILTYNSKDDKKVFAIYKNMWYNESTTYSGLLYPLKKLLSRLGIIIGALLFAVLSYLGNTFVVKVEYQGDSLYFKNEIDEVLKQNSVKEYSPFYGVSVDKINSDIFSSSSLIAFSSVTKRGNRLIVYTVKAVESDKSDVNFTDKIVASGDGKIVFIAVYRGTALKKAGDEVHLGEIIVDGYYTYQDEKRPTNVLARVTVEYCYTEEVPVADFSDNSVLRAIEIAEFNLGKECVKKENIIHTDRNTVEVKLYYRQTVSGG